LKAADIIRLIRESAKFGVAELQVGEIRVKFREAIGPGQDYVPESPSKVPGLPDQQNDSEIKLFDETEILEMEKSQQLVDDPVGFEIDQIRAQLENQRLAGELDEEAQA
jgi:hypothetical protein